MKKFTMAVGNSDWIVILVGGATYMTKRATLKAHPKSLLATLSEESEYYNKETQQYMFDRNPYIFQFILDFYRTGELHMPQNICGPKLKSELQFWGIDDGLVAQCCYERYHEFNEQEETLHTLGQAFQVLDRFPRVSNQSQIMGHVTRVREKIWLLLEDPSSSWAASIWAFIYILLVMASVLTLALETHEYFRVPSPINRTTLEGLNNPKQLLYDTTNPHPAMYYIDFLISLFFAINVAVRFIVCPSKVNFLKSFFNWLDIIVVVAQWTTTIIASLSAFWQDGHLKAAYTAFSLMRICRVLLIFKLARHYTGLRILLLALKASLRELVLLAVFIVIGMFIFSTLIYYAEFSRTDEFQNIPRGFWWSIITMTTVGYGDVLPKTHGGYLVGSFCALSGILALGLPIPIIANNFTLYYHVAKMKERFDNREEVKTSRLLKIPFLQNIRKSSNSLVDDLEPTDV